MKLQSLTNFLTKGAIGCIVAMPLALGTALTFEQPVRAQNSKFYCGWSGGYPATMANTSRGPVTVIRWSSEHFSEAGYDPQTRCNIVSSKFEAFYGTGSLNFITAGIVNRQPVVCATGSSGGPCSSSTVLYTLKPGQNAAVVLQRLYDVRTGAGGPLYESSKPVASNANVTSVNIREFLETAPVESATAAPSPNKPSTTPAAAQPSKPGSPSSGGLW